MEAEEIVTGSFRNIAGTITSMDAASNSVTVMDLLTKKTVVVKLSSQSQLRKLSPEVAQRIAFRLKAAAAGTSQTGNTTAAPGAAPSSGNRPADGAPAASASLWRSALVVNGNTDGLEATFRLLSDGKQTSRCIAKRSRLTLNGRLGSRAVVLCLKVAHYLHG